MIKTKRELRLELALAQAKEALLTCGSYASEGYNIYGSHRYWLTKTYDEKKVKRTLNLVNKFKLPK